jgi:hypothetical protein
MKRITLGLLAPVSFLMATGVVTGCKKEEPPPPLPSAQPVTAAPAPLQLKPEDAGVKPPPTDSGVKKVAHGGGHGGGGLGPCCAALQQNAASAPPPTNGYMLQAAAMCQALNAQGMGKAAVGQLLGLMRGAGMPPACK